MSSPSDAPPIRHDTEGEAFVIERDGQRLAEMTYTWLSDRRVRIDHTEVGEALKGQGAGKRLVMAAVAWARAGGLTIQPVCSYARSVFDKDPSIGDVRAAG